MLSRFKSVVINAVRVDSPPDGTSGSTRKVEPKFPYFRPNFLKLSGPDEINLALDRKLRPIIVPRDGSVLPWDTGYAECINSGKSVKNEDQAIAHENVLKKPPHIRRAIDIPYAYFGIFDGHAGTGAALCAANQLHHILHEKLVDVLDDIWNDIISENENFHPVNKNSLITGALESAFLEMDQLIAEDRSNFGPAGGCTALVALFLLGQLFVANAGDSRAIICGQQAPRIVTHDFTPETERRRVGSLAEINPSLLGRYFSSKEYMKAPTIDDLGKRILYKTPLMSGWSYKTVSPDDVKFPLVSGTGKRSRVMGTIGVTRGFGDHDLSSILDHSIKIKPFLSPLPEVTQINLMAEATVENEMVLVMGTDGLWDVTNNDAVNTVVRTTLNNFAGAKHRYISVAQALVAASRGKLIDDTYWRLSDTRPASIDDISVFVVPLRQHREAHERWLQEAEAPDLAQDPRDEQPSPTVDLQLMSDA